MTAIGPAGRAPVATAVDGDSARHMRALPPGEALQLLAGTPIGRVVFTQHALPAIRPVNHIVDQGDIIIRSHSGADLVNTANASGPVGVVVAYEADEIDPTSRTGWSVVVTGYATLVTDPEDWPTTPP